jgi:hypothetical protein
MLWWKDSRVGAGSMDARTTDAIGASASRAQGSAPPLLTHPQPVLARARSLSIQHPLRHEVLSFKASWECCRTGLCSAHAHTAMEEATIYLAIIC